ncbi:MAG: DUF305 domain-containing protein [Solirubrobacteraceae bacterium]|nr:DUF305 domain-containing protein [Solirubrobacteraceae bacterium]
MQRTRTSRRLLAGILIPLALTGTVAGCGDDGGDRAAAEPTATPHDMAGMNGTSPDSVASIATSPGEGAVTPGSAGEKVDQAFVRQMTPHHLGAVLMATIAVERADRSKLRSFAAHIVQDQTKELATLQRLGAPLGLDAGTSMEDGSLQGDLKTLGLPADSMSMSGDMLSGGSAPFGDVDADAFDRAFVDAMIEHHEGGVAMAKAERSRGSSAEIKDLAKEIEQAQEDELETLRAWQRHW